MRVVYTHTGSRQHREVLKLAGAEHTLISYYVLKDRSSGESLNLPEAVPEILDPVKVSAVRKPRNRDKTAPQQSEAHIHSKKAIFKGALK